MTAESLAPSFIRVPYLDDLTFNISAMFGDRARNATFNAEDLASLERIEQAATNTRDAASFGLKFVATALCHSSEHLDASDLNHLSALLELLNSVLETANSASEDAGFYLKNAASRKGGVQ